MPKITKTMQYEIVKPLSCDWNVFSYVLRQIQNESFRVKNRTIQLCYERQNLINGHRAKNGIIPKDRDLYGVPFRTYLYHIISSEYVVMNTGSLTLTIQKAEKLWGHSRSDVAKGAKSIPSFKKTNPIECNAKNIRNIQWSDRNFVELDLSLLSQKGMDRLKKNPEPNVSFDSNSITLSYHVLVHGGKSGAREIMNRLISKEYDLRGSMIVFNERKRKWLLSLTYDFESSEKTLNMNRVLGVDMGVVCAVYMAVNDSAHWRAKITGGEIEHQRKEIESRRRKLSSQASHCGRGRIGHGRIRRMRPLDKLDDKVKNFRNTVNYNYANKIVEYALRMDCGTIQVEDLSGIGIDNVFLGRWTYYDLQKKIENKAKERGILFRRIKPNYTSQRCAECGFIHSDNRRTQAEFECVMCGYKVNADFNGARNIANPMIEEIIKAKCKELSLKYDE